MRGSRRKIIGLTLLEMLVVLVLTSLLSLLLFQGLGYALTLRTRFVDQLDNLRQGAIQAHWFRSSTAGLIADYEDTPNNHVFKGDEKSFNGLTLVPLDEYAGVPTLFKWELETRQDMQVLRYHRSNAEVWDIAQWQLRDAESSFRYLGHDGKWHDEWPPRQGLEPPQLPKAIMLSGYRRQQPFTWFVKMTGRYTPKEDYRAIYQN
ncbi:MAG: hypothetical protein AAF512_08575 [Pseudomonadota bacterium]